MDKSTHSALNRGDLSNIATYQAGIVQASVHRTLQKISDEALKPFGISKMQWLIIGCVLDAGTNGARITDIAKTLDTTLSYLTNAINVMELKNILQRGSNKGDSRSKLVVVHPDFAPKCEAIEQALRQALRDTIYAHVDPQEFRIYMKVLYQMYNLKNETDL
jgi:DNA-binding MarR family transcriptional regulator